MALCACGCGQETEIGINSGLPNKFVFGHQNGTPKPIYVGAPHLCACGCGEETKMGIISKMPNKFIKGHNRKGRLYSTKKPEQGPLQLCECGCGRVVTYPWNKFIYGHNNKGKIVSEETRQKLRDVNTGRPVSDETRQKLRDANIGKWCGKNSPMYGRTGVNHPSYIDGRSKENDPYCEKFNNILKEKIRNRDNRTCQNCGIKENGRKHAVHHLHYDKKNCYPDLITLCNSCNGKANFNRDYWEGFYMNKLYDRGLLHWMV